MADPSAPTPRRPPNDWDAATYDRIADPQTRWGATVVERLELDGHETVLDAGCGSGRVTAMLLARLPAGRVVAVDASPSMLVEARRRLGAGAPGRVQFLPRDLLDLVPADLDGAAPVDAVLSTAVFHWVLDHDLLFRNLAALLRPGGQLVAQCGGAGNIAGLIDIVERLGAARAGAWLYAGVEDTERRLAAAGFVDVRVWRHDEPTPFAPDELEPFLETVCLQAHVAGMPEAERRSFIRRVSAAMPEPVIDYVRLNIVARRA